MLNVVYLFVTAFNELFQAYLKVYAIDFCKINSF